MGKTREEQWWELIRNEELSTALNIFPKRKNLEILEIGGRDGFQADIISKKGHKVTSIDINPLAPQFHLVQKGDITKLNFEDNSFDLIFSSNMLQEIHNIDEAFTEMKRVLKEDGTIVHIVPSSWWSLITNFWHYVLLPKVLYKKIKNTPNSEKFLENDKNASNYKKNRLMNLLFFHPLGTEKSFINEIFKFSKKNWSKMFVSFGFIVNNELNGPLVYSGYNIFSNRGYKIRKILSGVFPCSYIFITKKTV